MPESGLFFILPIGERGSAHLNACILSFSCLTTIDTFLFVSVSQHSFLAFLPRQEGEVSEENPAAAESTEATEATTEATA